MSGTTHHKTCQECGTRNAGPVRAIRYILPCMSASAPRSALRRWTHSQDGACDDDLLFSKGSLRVRKSGIVSHSPHNGKSFQERRPLEPACRVQEMRERLTTPKEDNNDAPEKNILCGNPSHPPASSGFRRTGLRSYLYSLYLLHVIRRSAYRKTAQCMITSARSSDIWNFDRLQRVGENKRRPRADPSKGRVYAAPR